MHTAAATFSAAHAAAGRFLHAERCLKLLAKAGAREQETEAAAPAAAEAAAEAAALPEHTGCGWFESSADLRAGLEVSERPQDLHLFAALSGVRLCA